MTAGLPLLVTRPDPGGAATVERARALGLDARPMPLFEAHALPWTAPDPADFDAMLVTSAQAVRLSGPELVRLAALPVHAVGAATAQAAEAAGLTVAAAGDSDAQHLLGAMASQGIGSILWLCGRDRSAFDARGARLVAIPCYAVDPVPPPREWAGLIAAPAVLLAHSARGAARIADLAGAARKHLKLVAISAKAAAAAGGGWAEIAVAGRPNDAAMLAEAHALCHKGDK
ncbi:uroporphyrinogen-III synthase [Sphingopyxis sp. J-6]|uniref:uroporphyrinogen-III synthase n=1 Tax=Sphingopyxis sp. J-6 TaxID=3122054 RepID=UPI003983F86E